MSRPAVGITAAIESARWTVWEHVEANLSPRAYSREVEAAGGFPLLLPAQDPDPARVAAILDRLAALVIAGGADLDPASYGADPAPETTGFNAERDRFELALTAAALERDLPVLGICRGMQILNVARGGTLEQHLDAVAIHVHTPGTFSDHAVRLEPGSLAARAVAREHLSVRSHHHQGIAELGDGIVASGWSEPDGLIEAIELPGHPFAMGVLWHAEEEPGGPVMRALCEAALEREAVA